MLPLLLSVTYLMVYEEMIPLGIVGLLQITLTVLTLILIISLIIGGLETVDQFSTYIIAV